MSKRNLILVICSLLVFGVSMRLLPHLPNFTPVTSLAFVAALYLGKRWALLLPVATVILSDVWLGFYDWKILLSVYGSFILIGLLSIVTSRRRSIVSIGVAVVGSSLFFFFVTNTAVWAFSPWYEKTFTGLLYAYELGLPFLRNMLMGDFLYTTLLICTFEVCYWLKQRGVRYWEKQMIGKSALVSQFLRM